MRSLPLVVALIDIPQPWVLSTDRTEWSFGTTRFNILMLEHRFSNQFFILQDETFNLKTTVSALTSQPNVKKF